MIYVARGGYIGSAVGSVMSGVSALAVHLSWSATYAPSGLLCDDHFVLLYDFGTGSRSGFVTSVVSAAATGSVFDIMAGRSAGVVVGVAMG